MERKNIVALAELEPYIKALLDELHNLGYSYSSHRRMKSVWDALLAYAAEHKAELYNAEFRQKFILDHFGHCLGDKHPAFIVSRALNMLSDYIDYGMVFKQSCNKGQPFSPGYEELFNGYLQYLKDVRRLSDGSLKTWRSRLYKLEHFLVQSDVEQFCEVTIQVVNRYIKTLAGYSSTTTSEIIREFRYLSDFAYKNGYHLKSFASALPQVKNTRQQRLPSIFTPEEIRRLLESVDRDNPLGKRDYAILLVAARMGLRISDIRALEFGSFNWAAKKISIVQQKTGKFLELPLPDDVGWAIIDYLQNGQPETDCTNIFIKHRPPYDGLGVNINIVQKQMRKAGIESPANKRIGMHALRHGLASSMLENGVSYSPFSGKGQQGKNCSLAFRYRKNAANLFERFAAPSDRL